MNELHLKIIEYYLHKKDYLDLKVFAQTLGMLPSNVSRIARLYGLTTPTRKKRIPDSWSAVEVDYLMKNFYTHSNKYLSVVLKKSISTISRKANSLGMNKKNHKVHDNGHPRGFLGKKHSQKSREKMSKASKRAWEDTSSKFHSEGFRQKKSDRMKKARAKGLIRNPYSRTKSGKRKDLDLFVRSTWEANYARYLNFLISSGAIKKWEYEPDRFEFPIKRGTRSYTPDFKITNPDGSIEYHEVKGWMDKKSKTRLKRMAQYYPDVKLVVVDGKSYKEIEKEVRGFIKHWE